jgi:hypothetical protein
MSSGNEDREEIRLPDGLCIQISGSMQRVEPINALNSRGRVQVPALREEIEFMRLPLTR